MAMLYFLRFFLLFHHDVNYPSIHRDDDVCSL